MLAQFLNVALDIQQTPAYAGIRVTGGTLAASDGVILVAYKLNTEYIRGEGMIPPATARALAALANEVYLDYVEVDGTAVNLVTREQYADRSERLTVTFPPFACRVLRIESFLPRCVPPDATLLCEAPSLKIAKIARITDFVELVDKPMSGSELFQLKLPDAKMWYSVRQLREGLRLFRARDAVSVFRNEQGWLSFRDDWGRLFAVTPFVKRD
jgi:hypothetical protein